MRNVIVKMFRSLKLPTFLCPFESLYIDEMVDFDWGKENKNLNLLDKWNSLIDSFPINSLILFTGGSGSREGHKGIIALWILRQIRLLLLD